MATKVYMGQGGVAKKQKKMYIGVGGVAHKVKKGYIGINGVAHKFFDDTVDIHLTQVDSSTGRNMTPCDGNRILIANSIYNSSYTYDVYARYGDVTDSSFTSVQLASGLDDVSACKSAYANGVYVVIYAYYSSSTSYVKVRYSTDLTNWSTKTLSVYTGSSWSSSWVDISVANGYFVVRNYTKLYYSKNGSSWTTSSYAPSIYNNISSDLKYVNGYYVYVSGGTTPTIEYATSLDGSWTKVELAISDEGETTPNDAWMNDICYTNGYYEIAGRRHNSPTTGRHSDRIYRCDTLNGTWVYTLLPKINPDTVHTGKFLFEKDGVTYVLGQAYSSSYPSAIYKLETPTSQIISRTDFPSDASATGLYKTASGSYAFGYAYSSTASASYIYYFPI